MKYIFGKTNHTNPIEAKNLELAIKIFKISELYPEDYVDPDDIETREYESGINRYKYTFKSNPQITIQNEKWEPIGKISLYDCINVDYKSLLPVSSNLLEAPNKQPDKETGTDIAVVIGDPKNLPKYDKAALREMNNQLLLKKKEMEMMMSEIHASMNLIKAELDNKKKLLYILETYLGLNEEVLHIKEGKPASEEEPLSLYQQVLYMDEEVGIWHDGGLDFQNIELFDEFIIKHYDKFLYKEKSICAFHVRRRDKQYTNNAIANMFMNDDNHKTYFLIRNGENLYRIWSNVDISRKLFPSVDEYEKALTSSRSAYAKEDVQRLHERYFYGVIAIQGLIERTDILGTSLRSTVNLVKNTGIDRINFVRDAEQEFWITSGRLSWQEFYKKNRETITEGTRILVTQWISPNEKDSGNRFYPFRPSRGPTRTDIYEVVEHVTDEEKRRYHHWSYKIMYLPPDTIFRRYDYGDRKKRIPCWLYSDEVINFDAITIEDCDYYEKNRLERHNYLDLLPVLHFMKKKKLEEQALENEFIKYISGLLNWEEARFPEIQKAIDWWKLKNKWKRGLMKDDAKAVRMIVKKLK